MVSAEEWHEGCQSNYDLACFISHSIVLSMFVWFLHDMLYTHTSRSCNAYSPASKDYSQLWQGQAQRDEEEEFLKLQPTNNTNVSHGMGHVFR